MANAVDNLIAHIMEQIQYFQEEMQQNNLVDVSAMHADVEQLCNQIKALPVGEAMQYKEPVEEIMAQVQNIESLLLQQKDMVEDRLKGLQQNAQAHKAYAKSDALYKEPPKDS